MWPEFLATRAAVVVGETSLANLPGTICHFCCIEDGRNTAIDYPIMVVNEKQRLTRFCGMHIAILLDAFGYY